VRTERKIQLYRRANQPFYPPLLVGNDTSNQTSSHSSATFANVEALTGFGRNGTMSFENHFHIVTGHDHLRLIGAWESEIGSFV
jgi:hypothetical protein